MKLTRDEWYTLSSALNSATPRALRNHSTTTIIGDGVELEDDSVEFMRTVLWLHLRDMYPNMSPDHRSRSLQLLTKLHEDE